MDQLARGVRVTIHRAALDAIFDECDRYDRDETGGRLIGNYRGNSRGRLSITVSGVIEAGPKASRSATSFFQDGNYQEEVFRAVESRHPQIEHLGNWHTHHVNGYPTLSRGDRETYHRVVTHPNHNTHFFYALLVTARTAAHGNNRYATRHFILFRDDPAEYEISESQVRIVDRPILWPISLPGNCDVAHRDPDFDSALMDQRARDSQFFSEFQPRLQPYMSKKDRRIYWRGRICLVDDSSPEIVVLEPPAVEEGYEIALTSGPMASSDSVRTFLQRRFRSAREAVVLLERELNREIFRTRVMGID